MPETKPGLSSCHVILLGAAGRNLRAFLYSAIPSSPSPPVLVHEGSFIVQPPPASSGQPDPFTAKLNTMWAFRLSRVQVLMLQKLAAFSSSLRFGIHHAHSHIPHARPVVRVVKPHHTSADCDLRGQGKFGIKTFSSIRLLVR